MEIWRPGTDGAMPEGVANGAAQPVLNVLSNHRKTALVVHSTAPQHHVRYNASCYRPPAEHKSSALARHSRINQSGQRLFGNKSGQPTVAA